MEEESHSGLLHTLVPIFFPDHIGIRKSRILDNSIFSGAEGSHSGRVHRLGKAACPKGYREFESRPLRAVENELSGESEYALTGIGGSNPTSSAQKKIIVGRKAAYPQGYREFKSRPFRHSFP